MDYPCRNSRGQCRVSDGERDHRRPWWVRRWALAFTLISGVLSLLWLLLRSGPKPSRLAYPCQQAAFGTAAAAFAVPFAAGVVALRARIAAALRTAWGRSAAGAVGVFSLVILVFASAGRDTEFSIGQPPPDYQAEVYVVNDARGIGPGRYGGVDDLITLMGVYGLFWHRSSESGLTAGPNGLIDADDVVLIKVNAQWSQRGGTNTDVLRGVIRRIVEHPDGFVGEVIVADNGQGYGSLDHTESNAEDHEQSAQDVVNDFAVDGWSVSTYLWDPIRTVAVDEYATGDLADGYVANPDFDLETQIKVSYPKFQTPLGAYVSYKLGIWSPTSRSYDRDKLVVINIPVLKTHATYAITASVKNHMGVVTTGLNTNAHDAVGNGGMGSVLAEVRLPDITILDCIWILARPGMGPRAYYDYASRRDQLVASTDPVALDMWATKFIMIPQIIENDYPYSTYHDTQDPDNPESDFRRYLDRSMNEMLLADIDTTNDIDNIDAHVWLGDVDGDGDVDTSDYSELALCLAGPGVGTPTDCESMDWEPDDHVDLADVAAFQRMFTGSFE